MYSGPLLDTEESKNVAVVHKTNQGYSGKDLYRLKQERPELFSIAGPSSDATDPQIPKGYRAVSNVVGYYYNAERNIYWEKSSGRFLCRDTTTNEYYDHNVGDDFSATLSIRGDAAACASQKGVAGGRHVTIGDLHRAAASMKLDLSHHDSPAAMYAIYDSAVGGSSVAEAAAKGFHVRLLPRMASYRGAWSEERLKAVVSESIETLSQEISADAGITMALALLVGRRLVLASSRGGLCMLFGPAGIDAGFDCGDVEVTCDGSVASISCIDLDDDIHQGVLLTVDALCSSGITFSRLRSLVRQHVAADRARAACIAALAEARRSGIEAPLVAAAVRLSWAQDDNPSAKRPRKENLTKVRCRHILLRHAGSKVQASRKPKATRSVHEAESQMLGLLQELQFGGAPAFTERCRKMSDCDTSLKGGDLCGDLGWLDKDPTKNKKVPASVVRAALMLTIGQFSDIISSELGVHLLLRTA